MEKEEIGDRKIVLLIYLGIIILNKKKYFIYQELENLNVNNGSELIEYTAYQRFYGKKITTVGNNKVGSIYSIESEERTIFIKTAKLVSVWKNEADINTLELKRKVIEAEFESQKNVSSKHLSSIDGMSIRQVREVYKRLNNKQKAILVLKIVGEITK